MNNHWDQDSYFDYDRYVDYKAMYLKAAGVAEEAVRLLIEMQRECEEMYVSAVDQRMEDLGLALLSNEEAEE